MTNLRQEASTLLRAVHGETAFATCLEDVGQTTDSELCEILRRSQRSLSAELSEAMYAVDDGQTFALVTSSSLDENGNIISGASHPEVGVRNANYFVLVPQQEQPDWALIIDATHPAVNIDEVALEGLEGVGAGSISFEYLDASSDGCLLVKGLKLQMILLAGARYYQAACTEMMCYALAAIEEVGSYLARRRSSAGDYLSHQIVRHQIAESESLIRVTASGIDVEIEAEDQRGCSELFLRFNGYRSVVTETLSASIDRCLQLMGGGGYMSANRLSHALRDSLSLKPLWSQTLYVRRPAVWSGSKSSQELAEFELYADNFITNAIIDGGIDSYEPMAVSKRTFCEFGGAGLIGQAVPERWGGADNDFRYSAALVRTLMKRRQTSAAISVMLAANTVCPLLLRFASEELKRKYLPSIVSGNVVPSLAITEAGGSSELITNLRTNARKEGDDWIINGEKLYITNGPIADVVFALVRPDTASSRLDMALIAVPTDTPGFAVMEEHQKVGLKGSPTGRLRFVDCRVPVANTIGRENHGFHYFSEIIAEERVLIATGAVALARSCLEEIYGQTTAFNGVLERELQRLDGCENLCRSIVAKVAAGERVVEDAWLLKSSVCEIAYDAMETVAAEVGSRPHVNWIDRLRIDARVFTIFAGASDVMRDLYGSRLAGRFRVKSRAVDMALSCSVEVRSDATNEH